MTASERKPSAAGSAAIGIGTVSGLLIILAVGAALRLYGNDAGAPYRMSSDEPYVLGAAHRIIATGHFNPGIFDYGGLTFYVHAAVSAVAFLSGASAGRWSALDQVWMGDFLVATRTATALIGTLTIWLVFRVGLRWGPRVGLLAAAMMAVLPAHVREAHFALTDTPLTMCATLTLLLSIRAADTKGMREAALAGLAVGLTAAVKYNGLLVGIIPVIAALAFGRGRVGLALTAVAGGAVAGFLLGAPYSVIDLPNFLNQFAALLQSYNRQTTGEAAAWVYLGHLRNWLTWPGVLPLSLGYISLGLAAVGAARAVTHGDAPGSRFRGLLVISFPLVYLWFLTGHGGLIYGRYLMPIASMLAVTIGLALAWLTGEALRRWPRAQARAAGVALLTVVMAPPAAAAVAWTVNHAKVTTLDQTGGWLTRRTSPGERIVMEGAWIHLPPGPVLHHVRALTERTLDEYRADGISLLVASDEIDSAYAANPVIHKADIEARRALLAGLDVVQTFAPTPARPGPTISIIRLPTPAPTGP
jgi:4-amino-4-deoxy-L-arabinose transferase-like glycosyltransferase